MTSALPNIKSFRPSCFANGCRVLCEGGILWVRINSDFAPRIHLSRLFCLKEYLELEKIAVSFQSETLDLCSPLITPGDRHFVINEACLTPLSLLREMPPPTTFFGGRPVVSISSFTIKSCVFPLDIIVKE